MGTGWKTYAAGVLGIIWGVGGLYFGLHGPDSAIAFVSGGLGMIGLRHKLESVGIPKEIVDRLAQVK